MRYKKIIKVSIVGIILNIILSILKLVIGLLINSISMVTDAINNLSDASVSIITIVGTKLSLKKPDLDHPYGHGRIEYFSALIISFIVIMAGIMSLNESIQKIINPVKPHYDIYFLLVLILSIIVKIFISKYFKKYGKETHSKSLEASGEDALMDTFISLSVLLSAIVNIIFDLNIEGIVGSLISLVVIKSGLDILSDNIKLILGERVDPKICKNLIQYINSFDKVQGTYDVFLHSYGPEKIIGAVNIEVDEEMKAKEIDHLTRKINRSVLKKFNIFLTIGIYAVNEDEKANKIKQELYEIVNNIREIIQVHGFYIDGNTIYFDLIISFDEKDPDKIKDLVINKMKEKYSKYDYEVFVDIDAYD